MIYHISYSAANFSLNFNLIRKHRSVDRFTVIIYLIYHLFRTQLNFTRRPWFRLQHARDKHFDTNSLHAVRCLRQRITTYFTTENAHAIPAVPIVINVVIFKCIFFTLSPSATRSTDYARVKARCNA